MTWLMLALMLALSSPSAFGQLPTGYYSSFYATSSPSQRVREYLASGTTTPFSVIHGRRGPGDLEILRQDVLEEPFYGTTEYMEYINSFAPCSRTSCPDPRPETHCPIMRGGDPTNPFMPSGVYYWGGPKCTERLDPDGRNLTFIVCSEFPEHAGIHLHCKKDMNLPIQCSKPFDRLCDPYPEPEPVIPPAFGRLPTGYHASFYATSSPFKSVRDYLSGVTSTKPSSRTIEAEANELIYSLHPVSQHYSGCGYKVVGKRQTFPHGVYYLSCLGGYIAGIYCSEWPEHQGIHLHCTNDLHLTPRRIIPECSARTCPPCATSRCPPAQPCPDTNPNRYTAEPVGNLEVPSDGSFQSGIGYVSGWVCEGRSVSIVIDGGLHLPPVARNIARGDTEAVCGDQDNGFILQWNYNLMGDGTYTAALVVDGQTLQENRFTVTTLGKEFIRGLERDVDVTDFPAPGEITRFRWQEAVQGLVLVPD